MAHDLECTYDPDRDIVLEGGGEVEIIWYVDYTCRHTRRIRDIIRRSPKRFGEQSTATVVRFIMPEEGDRGAELAARAAIAAERQGKFADMHRLLFEQPPQYTQEGLENLARHLSLDLYQFRDDMRAEATDEKLAFDRNALGDTSDLHMPLIFIDGRFYGGAWDEDAIIDAIERPLGVRISLAGEDFFHWAASAGLVLILATLAALVVANVGWHDSYEQFRETDFALSFGEHSFALPLEMWINDGLMALFFLLVGIEIKREIIFGELSEWDRAILPIIGAVGGMVVPALVYVGINFGGEYIHGWGVPMATDIAFTLGIMALLGSKVPTSLKVFVSALAIADDLGAIMVIALFYGEGFHLQPFFLALAVMAVMAALNWGRVWNRMPYMFLGVVLWYYIHESGLHATLAGVITAAMLPSRRPADGRSVAAQAAAIVEGEDEPAKMGDTAVRRLQNAVERLREPGFHLQEALEAYSNYLILPLFAFFNTGLLIIGSSFSPLAPESLGVMLGLLIGKPLGIVGIVWIATKLGFARLSSEISWLQMIGAGFLAGVGFTMSIFISSAAFEGGELESVKLAVLLASTCAAVAGSAILWFAPKIGANGTG
ncbi:Na+/H+ antiporter NhaA [Sagittula salina]|uniref:Na(+)/H(+) antiporter NhaA n=1 Tax=Sagittula salina TaxID=2820268 RepID=A0A940ML46_9RHOB|nr:Na+/H+ antiporter NhaA [Sagittula salina]MBP0483820.1 Na+/H+ antiporter NhaA [Sagittula salina]